MADIINSGDQHTTAQLNTITPSIGDVLYDKTKATLVVGDGKTKGGNPQVSENAIQTLSNKTLDNPSYTNLVMRGLFAYLTAEADTTITTAGTYYPILGTFNNDPIYNFSSATVNTPGIKYDDSETMFFEIDWHATISASVLDTNVNVAISKNGTELAQSTMSAKCLQVNSPYNLSGTCVVELSEDDEIQLIVTADGDGDVITFTKFVTTIRPFLFG